MRKDKNGNDIKSLEELRKEKPNNMSLYAYFRRVVGLGEYEATALYMEKQLREVLGVPEKYLRGGQ